MRSKRASQAANGRDGADPFAQRRRRQRLAAARRVAGRAQRLRPGTCSIRMSDTSSISRFRRPALMLSSGRRAPFSLTLKAAKILDFHGNSVHQLGHGHPKVISAIKAELDRLPFSPRRYANRAGDRACAPPRRGRARRTRQGFVRAQRGCGGKHGAQTRPLCDRAAQDALDVERLSRRQSRHDFGRRRSALSHEARADVAGRGAFAASQSGAPFFWRRQAVRALCRLHRLCSRSAGRRRRAPRGADPLDERRAAAARLLAAGARKLRPPRGALDLRRNPELPWRAPARCSPAKISRRRPTSW